MLKNTLLDFQKQVNSNSKIKKITKNWNPHIIIKTNDAPKIFTVIVNDSKISALLETHKKHTHELVIEGKENILTAIFNGELNPAQAALDGKLAIFGDHKDQIKLDIISLVLWGG